MRTASALIIALYDGAIRFLCRLSSAHRRNDAVGRRAAVKRTVDIIMYLQARLRADQATAAAHLAGLHSYVHHDADLARSALKTLTSMSSGACATSGDAWVVVLAAQLKASSPRTALSIQTLRHHYLRRFVRFCPNRINSPAHLIDVATSHRLDQPLHLRVAKYLPPQII